MGAVRTFAHRLLRAVVRRCPAAGREWAEAMLRELEFIDSDWEAFFWALGSTAAIFRHSVRILLAWLTQPSAVQERKMNDTGKKTLGVLSGMGLALAFALALVGVFFLTAQLFPSLGLFHTMWTHLLFNIVLPEIIFVVVAIRLWRTRLPVAAGILITAGAIAIHILVHFAGR